MIMNNCGLYILTDRLYTVHTKLMTRITIIEKHGVLLYHKKCTKAM